MIYIYRFRHFTQYCNPLGDYRFQNLRTVKHSRTSIKLKKRMTLKCRLIARQSTSRHYSKCQSMTILTAGVFPPKKFVCSLSFSLCFYYALIWKAPWFKNKN